MSSTQKSSQIDLTTNKLAAALDQSPAPKAEAKVEVKKEIKDGASGKNVVKIGGEVKVAEKNVAKKKAVKKPAAKAAKKTSKPAVKAKSKQVKVALKKVIEPKTAKKIVKKAEKKAEKAKPVKIAKNTQKKIKKTMVKAANKTIKQVIRPAARQAKQVAAKEMAIASALQNKNIQTQDFARIFEAQSIIARQSMQQGFEQIQQANKIWAESVNGFFKAFSAK